MAVQKRQPPQRTCLACRTTGDKRELTRLVRLRDGGVEVDLTGKRPGRGAYICPEASCWEAALKKGRLDASLRTKLSAGDRLQLTEFVTTLPKAVPI